MEAIIIDAELGQDHRLIYELPPEVPVGPAKVEARQRLLAAGKLFTQSKLNRS